MTKASNFGKRRYTLASVLDRCAPLSAIDPPLQKALEINNHSIEISIDINFGTQTYNHAVSRSYNQRMIEQEKLELVQAT